MIGMIVRVDLFKRYIFYRVVRLLPIRPISSMSFQHLQLAAEARDRPPVITFRSFARLATPPALPVPCRDAP